LNQLENSLGGEVCVNHQDSEVVVKVIYSKYARLIQKRMQFIILLKEKKIIFIDSILMGIW